MAHTLTSDYRASERTATALPALEPNQRKVHTLRPIVLLILATAVAGSACGNGPAPPATEQQEPGRIMSEPPTGGNPDDRFVFYLHGKIVEDQGIRPEHPRFGIYEYQQILDQLSQPGLIVISEVRAARTNGPEYARRVVDQVKGLIDRGVPPGQITVIGFSKGGAIAIHVCSMLDNDEVNFVLLSACGGWIERRPQLVPHGRVLALYEASDGISGSCRMLFERRSDPWVHHEIELHLGGGHGAFYRPAAEWLEPVIKWATSDR